MMKMNFENDARAVQNFDNIKELLIKIGEKIDDMQTEISELWQK